MHRASPARRQPRLEERARPTGSVGTSTRGGHLGALHVELFQERRHQAGAIEVLDAVDDPPAATEHTAAPDEEHLERRLEVVLGERDHVEVLGRRQHHLLRLEGPACGEQLVAVPRRLLELLPLGGRAHLLLETPEHRACVATQELRHGVDVRSVRLLGGARGLGHARAGAPADVVVQARPLRTRPLVEEGVRARPHREDTGQGIERVADRPGVPVGPEVPHPLALGAAEHLRARPLLPHGEREVRIGLVVAIADVEPRLVLLDEVVLQQQGVDLGRRDDPLHRGGRLRHRRRPRVQRPAPVRHQALAQGRGLARRRPRVRPRRGRGTPRARPESRRAWDGGRSCPRC